MKIGKIELQDWITPIINGTPYYCWYRIEAGAVFNGNYQTTNCVFINCSSPGRFWAEFCGKLRFLDNYYQPRDFSSYQEAMEYVDIFLRRMDNLIIFT